MEDFAITDRRRTYDGVRITVDVATVRMPDGTTAERELVRRDDAVAVVAVHDDGTVTLVRQYRTPFDRLLLELPAGVLDVEGEDPAVAARRELAEECRLDAAQLTELTTIATSAGWSTERCTIYLATGLSEVDVPDGFEPHGEEAAMTIERIPLSGAVEQVRSRQIMDAKTVVGLLLAEGHPALPAARPASTFTG